MNKNYRIGLDIGIGSVGYAVLENDTLSEDPCRILDLGVRTFSPNEVEKTGESTAKNRREKRGVRRRARRKKYRKERIINLISKTFNMPAETICPKPQKGEKQQDVYYLRAKALDEKLTNEELARVILNIAKRRGFQSNRKERTQNDDEGKLLSAITQNKKFIEENGYRTIGEAFYKDEHFKITSCDKTIYNIRNHGGDYKNCFSREDLKNELDLILRTQQKLGNNNITNEFIDSIVYIFAKQRNFDEGPGKQSPYHKEKFEIGLCTFLREQGEERAPKASYTFELFSALSKINSLKINGVALTLEQKQAIYNSVLENKETKFGQIRKLLNIDFSKTFNLCRYERKKPKKGEEAKVQSDEEIIISSENANFITFKNSFDIKKALEVETLADNQDLIDEIALMLSICKSDERIDNYIQNSPILQNLNQTQITNIKGLNFDKFGSLSIKAMKMIIPFLFEGERYDVACIKAGFTDESFQAEKLYYLKGEKINELMQDVTSNVVKRAVNQTLRVVNEIIKKYGSPQFVSIELARELSKNFQDRQAIKRKQQENALKNEEALNQLKTDFNLSKPNSFDALKLKLYYEQNGQCMYSGKPIEIKRLYEPNYVQVDHILPFSRSMDDSFNNKVLVLASENQNKGDRTPYEYFGSDETRWNNFVARVNTLQNDKKKDNLLKQNFGEEQQNEFIERNLNDTKYMAKFLLNMFQNYLQLNPSKKYKEKAQVRSVNGAVTSYLRKCWGINKLRDDGDIHHAIDAVVISTVSPGQIKTVTEFNKLKEKFVDKDEKFINVVTGEVMTEQEKEEYEKSQIDILSHKLPFPYEHFRKELEIRSTVKYEESVFNDYEKQELLNIGYLQEEVDSVKPVFVSRMKNVKTTGAIHKETIMSTREYSKTNMLIKTVSIQELKLCSKPEKTPLKNDKYPNESIEDYYSPESDRLLYLALKEYLHDNGSIPKTITFYKPRKDGSNGPIVRTVKKYVKNNKAVILPNGGAENSPMYRVDVFEKQGKFYLCPIYYNDVYAKKLPNKVIERDKDWITIDKTFNFKFSLYQNDLVRVKSKKEIVLNKNFDNPKSNKPDKISSNEFLLYYNGTCISTASIGCKSHDNCYRIDSLGVKTLESFEKCYVDIMGKVYNAPKEERKGF